MMNTRIQTDRMTVTDKLVSLYGKGGYGKTLLCIPSELNTIYYTYEYTINKPYRHSLAHLTARGGTAHTVYM